MIYCAFDPLNIPKDPNTNEDIHVCKNYGSFLCAECQSRYDGDRIKEYMEAHPREH